MAQWRKLYVKTTESLDINDMPDDFTRLLWVMLPLKLCRDGRGMDSPAWIRSSIFPLRDDVTLDMVSSAMDWYANHGMIVRYEVNGRRYFYVPTWERYQGDTSKEAESIYPAPPAPAEPAPDVFAPIKPTSNVPAPAESTPELLQSYSRVTPELLQSNSRATPELLQSYSSTDVDVDVDADTDAKTDTDADANAEKEKDSAGKFPAHPPDDPISVKKPTPKTKTAVPEAIKVFRQSANRYPARSWYADVVAVVGHDPPDLERWGQVVKEWVGNGWNPTNVRGMLDKFQGKTKDGTSVQENGRKVIMVS